MLDWRASIWRESPFPAAFLMRQRPSPQLAPQPLRSPTPAGARDGTCGGCSASGHSDPRAGAGAGRPLEGLSAVGAQGEKKLHVLAGFWVGLRNSFAPLLCHTALLVGSTLDFTIYWTILKNCSKVGWIWAAAGPVFQHLYFQLVCQILFQTFHSFVLCNFFFNELAWGTEFSHI